MTQKIILPLGGISETEINEQISLIVTQYNKTVADAKHVLLNSLTSLEESVCNKLTEEIKKVTYEVPVFEIINAGRLATIAEAKEILGPNFIGPESIGIIFQNARLDIPRLKDTETIPFTVDFLQNMKNCKEGAVLMYQPTMDGKAINLTNFASLQKGLVAKPDGELLYRDQLTKDGTVSKNAWFAEEKYSEYRNQQVVKPGWRIATKTIISNTTSKRFVAQALINCTFIETLCTGMVMPQVLQDAIVEFREKSDNLQELQNNNPKQFLVEIQATFFWKHCMESGLETLFRLVVCNQANGEKLLVNVYTRNAVIEPVDASLGYSGRFDSDGPSLRRFDAGNEYDYLGLGFSWYLV